MQRDREGAHPTDYSDGDTARKLAVRSVDVLPAAPGRLDALLRELGPELGLVVDGEGRPAGVVRWGLRGVEAVEG